MSLIQERLKLIRKTEAEIDILRICEQLDKLLMLDISTGPETIVIAECLRDLVMKANETDLDISDYVLAEINKYCYEDYD